MRGVYIIKNLYNGYVYIGSSIDIESRIIQHSNDLRKNTHYNYKLQKDFNKYREYFLWGVSKIFSHKHNREEIYCYEQYLLDTICDKYNILLKSTDHLLYGTEYHNFMAKERQLKLF